MIPFCLFSTIRAICTGFIDPFRSIERSVEMEDQKGLKMRMYFEADFSLPINWPLRRPADWPTPSNSYNMLSEKDDKTLTPRNVNFINLRPSRSGEPQKGAVMGQTNWTFYGGSVRLDDNPGQVHFIDSVLPNIAKP